MAEKSIVFSIEGMTCDHCVRAVTRALRDIDGVSDVTVALAEKHARIVYDDAKVSTATIRSAVEGEGYMAKPQP
jgi:copper ion binding protein